MAQLFKSLLKRQAEIILDKSQLQVALTRVKAPGQLFQQLFSTITLLPTFVSKSKLMTVMSQLTDKNLINNTEVSNALLGQLSQAASMQNGLDTDQLSFLIA